MSIENKSNFPKLKPTEAMKEGGISSLLADDENKKEEEKLAGDAGHAPVGDEFIDEILHEMLIVSKSLI
jgi:hypothetical protein